MKALKLASIPLAMLCAIWIAITSCSDLPDQSTSPTSASIESGEVHVDKGGSNQNRIDWDETNWDDPGIIHNRCMEVLGDSLSLFDSTRFSNYEACKNWTRDIVEDFLVDSLNSQDEDYWDYSFLDVAMDSAANFNSSYGTYCDLIDTLLERVAISVNEEVWLNRYANILYTWSLNMSQFEDSLSDFVEDVQLEDWEEDEQLVSTIASIGLYSWNMQYNEDWTDFPIEPPDMPGLISFDWRTCAQKDNEGACAGAAGGALVGLVLEGPVGAVKGAVIGAVGGGVGASAANAVSQLTGWW